MKASELIAALAKVVAEHGDVNVEIGNDIGSSFTLRNVETIVGEDKGRVGTLKEALDYYDPKNTNGMTRNAIYEAYADGLETEWRIYDGTNTTTIVLS